MKSAFALYLSLDVVELLCRSGDGWWRVGRADPCGSDLAGEMTALRTMAKIAVPGPATAKLILPNDQIRYLTVDTETDDAVMRTALVEAALGQATPYALADLVYDICPDGIQTHVAAVARETLAEAEAFAVEHGFAPLSFVAIPGDMPFMGEPFFGTSTHAVDVVPPGDVVEADGIAVVVTGDYMPPSVSFSNRRRQATVTPDPAPERGVPDPGPLIDAGPEFDMRILDGDVDIEPGTVPRGIEPMVPSPPLQISVADPAPFDTPPMRTRFLSCQKTDALPSAVILPDPDAPDVQPIATTAGDTADDRLLMTVFGARGNKPARGTPGLPGLVLATLLLIFLAVAALWVLLFLEDELAFIRSVPDETGPTSEPELPASASLDPMVGQATPETAAQPEAPGTGEKVASPLREQVLTDTGTAMLDVPREPDPTPVPEESGVPAKQDLTAAEVP